jgi:hypothetical protein
MACGSDWISVTPPERRSKQLTHQGYRVAHQTLTDDLMWFTDWVQHVTDYDAGEITGFVERGIAGFFIVGGQTNPEAFKVAETLEDGGDIVLTLIAGVFEGTFERTVDDRYSLAREPTYAETARWEGEGGQRPEAA